MKTLQNNFTTPEQSKRLLELGVPKNSADCRYENNWHHVESHTSSYTIPVFGHPRKEYNDDIPCWSVGRLMDIIEICSRFKWNAFDFTGTYLEQAIKTLEFLVDMREESIDMYKIDFSKLEE